MNATKLSLKFLEELSVNDTFKVNLQSTNDRIQVVSKELVDVEDEDGLRKLQQQADFLRDYGHLSVIGFEGFEGTTLYMEAMEAPLETLISKPRKLSASRAVELLSLIHI